MPEHKHAEVLRAIADGKEVQCKNPIKYEWEDMKGADPINNDYLEWRIKPEPKPDYVIKGVALYAVQKLRVDSVIQLQETTPILITFSGETNEPISVELVKKP